MTATLFHLIRHASHDRGRYVLVGRGPASLSARGRQEAEAVAAALVGDAAFPSSTVAATLTGNAIVKDEAAGVGVGSPGEARRADAAAGTGPVSPFLAAVLSSPQERARQTAAAIAARAGLAVTEEPGLDELDFGAWTGMSFDALAGDPRWRAFNTFRSAAPIPGGETMLAVQARAVAAVLRLRAAWPDAALALVSHADVLKAILAHFLGVPLELMRRIELAPASRSELVVYGEDAVVRGINLPAGL